uniref:Putative secreted protein n=1 Tax=Anopheles marajoara TaxID=58244 RepID=A0A2M4CA06_9DIPT
MWPPYSGLLRLFLACVRLPPPLRTHSYGAHSLSSAHSHTPTHAHKGWRVQCVYRGIRGKIENICGRSKVRRRRKHKRTDDHRMTEGLRR